MGASAYTNVTKNCMKTLSDHHSKLKALLAVSAGAVALPQVVDAAIIYSGTINEQVGFSPGFNASYTLDLPGNADLQLIRASVPGSYPVNLSNTARVDFRQLNGYARVRAYGGTPAFAKRNSVGLTWDGIVGQTVTSARIGWRSTYFTTSGPAGGVRGPGSFTDKYIAFKFQDSTAGNADRYGWALISMSVTGGFPVGSGPDVTLTSWAYDDSGAKIAMGAGAVAAVPEPSAAALMAIGALALGGVRRWRASKRAA